MIEIIITSFLGFFFNSTDALLTYLSMHRLPDELKAKESNPMISGLMKKRSQWTWVVIKEALAIFIIVLASLQGNTTALRLIAILFFVVSVNNLYVYLSRVIRKKKIRSPLYNILKVARVPEPMYFWIVAPVFFFISLGILLGTYMIGL